MRKKCTICGMMKKTTFNCSLCGKCVCLECYRFTNTLCVDCDTENYNLTYAEQISKYGVSG